MKIEELRTKYLVLQEPSIFSRKHWSDDLLNRIISDDVRPNPYELVFVFFRKKMKVQLEND